MKCPVCVEQGLKSRLETSGWGACTSMCDQTYYDEEGLYHHHDPNSTSSTMHCSNGHQIHISQYTKCSNCDYNANESCGTVFEGKEKVAHYKLQGDTWVKVQYSLSYRDSFLGFFFTKWDAQLEQQKHHDRTLGYKNPEGYENYKIEEIVINGV